MLDVCIRPNKTDILTGHYFWSPAWPKNPIQMGHFATSTVSIVFRRNFVRIERRVSIRRSSPINEIVLFYFFSEIGLLVGCENFSVNIADRDLKPLKCWDVKQRSFVYAFDSCSRIRLKKLWWCWVKFDWNYFGDFGILKVWKIK